MMMTMPLRNLRRFPDKRTARNAWCATAWLILLSVAAVLPAAADCEAVATLPHWVASWSFGGGVRDLLLGDGYALLASDTADLQVVDLSDPLQPQIAGSLGVDGRILELCQVGDRAYAVTDDGSLALLAIDLSDLSQPALLGSLSFSWTPNCLAVAGNYAYVGCADHSIKVVDISDPQSLHVVGVAASFNGPSQVAVIGDYLYAVGWTFGLQIYSLANPVSPAALGSTPMNYGEGLAVGGDLAFVADGFHGFKVVDVSNPNSPQLLSALSLPSECKRVTVRDGIAYIAGAAHGLYLIDVGNPQEAVVVGSVDIKGSANDMGLAGDLAYMAGSVGLTLIDVSATHGLSPLGGVDTPGQANAVAVQGGYAYVADGEFGGLQVVAIADPQAPQIIGSLETPGAGSDAARRLAVSGYHAYLADGNAGLLVIDISDPALPAIVGTYDTGAAFDVELAGDLLGVADGTGLYLYDASDPSTLGLLGSLPMAYPLDCVSVAIAGSLAYLAIYDTVAHNGAFQTVDISDPTAPAILGSISVSFMPSDVLVSDALAYVAWTSQGLVVIDVSDPVSPVIIGYGDGSGYDAGPQGIALNGEFLYVADYRFGLNVLDVTAPSLPQLVCGSLTGGHGSGIAIAGGLLYLACGEAGLCILPPVCGAVTGVEEPGPFPSSLGLCAAPNPGVDGTRLHFTLAEAGPVTVVVYDVGGRRLRELSGGLRGRGAQSISWDGRDGLGNRLPAGVYLARVETAREVATTRIVILR